MRACGDHGKGDGGKMIYKLIIYFDTIESAKEAEEYVRLNGKPISSFIEKVDHIDQRE